MSSDLDTWLKSQHGRCSGCGHDIKAQGCKCEGGDWSLFLAALRSAKREDGTVHPTDMRRLVRGRIAPKTIATCYRKARAENLLVEAGTERSDDVAGKNAGRHEPYYELRAA